jgi:transposase
MAEEEPSSLSSIAKSQRIPAKEFEKQYKEYLSGFKNWDQKEHAEQFMIFPENIGKRLSLDEVALTNGELYTVITNKQFHGKKRALVAMIQGTKSKDVAAILLKIPEEKRNTVKEITLDMAESMKNIAKYSFFNATPVTDRFHVQQLVSEATQEIRILLRKEAIREENEQIKLARSENKKYKAKTFENGDTKKQLLARSRYVLFKPQSKWHESQQKRSEILFREFPELKNAYDLSMMFRSCYENSHSIAEAKESFEKWYRKVEEKNIDSFLVAAESVRLHEATILNYFTDRSTNASAESFNAKLKSFRSVVRGVRDKKFHLFRVAKLYA